MIYYQVTWIFRIMGWFLPAIPALRILLGFWIMLPQFKGEFYLWHMLDDQVKKVEYVLMGYRCSITSFIVRFFGICASGSLKIMHTYVSEECIVKTEESNQQNLEILKEEMEVRTKQGGKPKFNLPKRGPSHVNNTETYENPARYEKRDSYISSQSIPNFKVNLATTLDRIESEEDDYEVSPRGNQYQNQGRRQ